MKSKVLLASYRRVRSLVSFSTYSQKRLRGLWDFCIMICAMLYPPDSSVRTITGEDIGLSPADVKASTQILYSV